MDVVPRESLLDPGRFVIGGARRHADALHSLDVRRPDRNAAGLISGGRSEQSCRRPARDDEEFVERGIEVAVALDAPVEIQNALGVGVDGETLDGPRDSLQVPGNGARVEVTVHRAVLQGLLDDETGGCAKRGGSAGVPARVLRAVGPRELAIHSWDGVHGRDELTIRVAPDLLADDLPPP